ncbi:hypothetical protein [Streptomyces sp. SBT349]|uniref:hypothetical protein n=1 Tax=Streptomyces sp. SBT349 TaxID=1580539 RepID=UPI00066D05BE|nr:hypothetical protein [Streptomyces sp. SBT349]
MDDFVINTTRTGIQQDPAVTAFGNESYFVVWCDTDSATIKGRIYMANGNPASGEFDVNEPDPAAPNTLRERPAVAATPVNGAFVAWVEHPASLPGPRPHVAARRFGTDGRPLGGVIRLSTADIDPDVSPALMHTLGGGFLVVWAGAAPDRRIIARRYGFTGSPEGEELLLSTTEGFHTGPFGARLDGNFAIGWRTDPHLVTGGDITLRVLTFDGAPVTGELTPDLPGYAGGGKAITALATEQFVLAHTSLHPDGSRSAVETHVFSKDGDVVEVGVPACSGPSISCGDPALAPLTENRFLTAWVQTDASSGTGHTVMAKAVSTTLGSLNEPVRLSGSAPGHRTDVAAATLVNRPDPTAFVAWTDLGGAGEDATAAVRGRVVRIEGEGTLV